MENKTYNYDVAISFAEEDRDSALSLALALKAEGLKAYYYPTNYVETWGTNLVEKLESIYSQEAQYAVILFSKYYLKEEKTFTKIELEAIHKRMDENSDIVYLLPIKLDKDISLSSFPYLEELTFLQWDHDAEKIADAIKKLIGKELREPDENSKAGNILYSSGEHPQIIVNTNISDFIPNIINNSDEIPALTEKDVKNIQQIFVLDSPEDTRFACVNCSTELNRNKYGEIECPVCHKINFIDNPKISARKHKTVVDEKEGQEYKKILAHIQNKIKDKDYSAAYNFCLKAEEIAPGEYDTWTHFALAEFLLEIFNKDKSKRKTTQEIIKRIKVHIEKCISFKISDKERELLLLDIANRLFSIEKARILSLMGRYDEEKGLDKWTKVDFRHLIGLLNSFEICYNLYKDPIFLEEYVSILSQNNKWMIKRLDDDLLINLPTPVFFNAKEKRKALIGRIKAHKEFNPHDIQKERMTIKNIEKFQILSANYNTN